MTAALEKLALIQSLKETPINALEVRMAVAPIGELPIWLMNLFAPEIRKDFPRLLEKAEKAIKSSGVSELELAIQRMEAELVKLKEALKDLKKNRSE